MAEKRPHPPVASSSRLEKIPRLSSPEREDPLHTREMEVAAFLDGLTEGSICTPAWSCTNLLAIPSPVEPSTTTTTTLLSTTLSVTLTHFTGTPTPPILTGPSSRSNGKGKGVNTSNRFSFTLTLPPLPPTSRITHLSFAPCGGHLLIVTSPTSTSVPGEKGGDMITVFEQKGCINEWEMCWNERATGFGEDLGGGRGKKALECRWLGEPRKWFPTPKDTEGILTQARPLYCAPHRSPPVSGSAFLLILSSDEVLFVHLPRSLPLLPLTLVLPLSASLSLTAIPTPPTVLHTTLASSPQNAIDDLVANLVEVMPNTPGTTVLGLATMGVGGKDGVGAMREELRAAERKETGGSARKVQMGAFGTVRGSQGAEWGATTFLIATISSCASSPCGPPSSPILDTLGLGVPIIDQRRRSSDFDMTDFSGLDEAFGDPPAVKVEESGGFKEGESVEKTSNERLVKLAELRVELTAQEGPKLTIRPLTPLHLSDPTSLGDLNGFLTHLEWLEDVEVRMDGEPIDSGSETATDLRLLAITASPQQSPLSNEESIEGVDSTAVTSSRIQSTISSWAFSNEPYPLSEAFGSLECRKGEGKVGQKEWVGRRAATTHLENLVTFIAPRLAPRFSSFLVGLSCEEPERCTEVRVLDSITLNMVENTTSTRIPGSKIYGCAQVSPNRNIICAMPLADSPDCQPTLAAIPLSDDSNTIELLSSLIAMSIARQLDTSDTVGRIIGLESDVSALQILRSARDILQSMLPTRHKFERSSLQLELIGIASNLFRTYTTLQIRATLARRIVELATAVRLFVKCEKKERTITDINYRCESDAIWPLIGHVKWYCDLCKDLVTEGRSSSSNPSPQLLLLIHPYTRSLLSRLASYVVSLQSFLASFPVGANVTVDLSRNVLDDAVDYGGLVIAEWRAALLAIDGLPELNIDSPQMQDLLVEFIIPTSLAVSSQQVVDLISSPTLLLTTPLTPPVTPKPHIVSTDIIKKGRLAEEGRFRVCTKCGERNVRSGGGLGVETGKWAAYEMGWDVRCCCGGLWAFASVGSV